MMQADSMLTNFRRLVLSISFFSLAVGCTGSSNSLIPEPSNNEPIPITTGYGEKLGQLDEPAPVSVVARPQAPTTPTSGNPIQQASAISPEMGTPQVRPVAVIGSGTVITDDEVWQVVRQRASEYVRLTGEERANKEKEIFQQSLRTLIERELILDDLFTKLKKNKPQLLDELKEQASETANKQVREFKKINNLTTEEDFLMAMRVQGLSPKSLHRQIQRSTLMTIYLSQLTRDKQKAITIADLERFYRNNPDEFKVEDRVKWLDLFVSFRRFTTTEEARAYALKLRKQLEGGGDFAAIAKEFGHGDSSLRQGEGHGEKRGEIRPEELESYIFELEPGKLSDLIPTEFGYHIIRVEERDYKGVRPFDNETQSAIRQKLHSDLNKEQYQNLIEDLWRKTTVKILELP